MNPTYLISPSATEIEIKVSGQFKVSTKDPVSLHDVLLTLDYIDYCGSRAKKPIHVNMAELESMNAQAAVLLFAYITSAQIDNNRGDFVRFTLPESNNLRNLVRNSGLWDAIRYGTNRKLDRNWVSLNNFQSGYDPDKHLDLTLDHLEQKWGSIPRHLGTAINEAMLNIKQHAYSNLSESSVRRWWQYIFIKNNELHFIIFDKGIGIPDSFRRKNQMVSYEDDELVEHAMQRWITSTNIKGRGNGSMNIKRPVSSIDRDTLLIYSHNGGYEYYRDGKARAFKLPIKLVGTLVAWKIGISDD